MALDASPVFPVARPYPHFPSFEESKRQALSPLCYPLQMPQVCFTSLKENQVLNLRGSLLPLPVLYIPTNIALHSSPSHRNPGFPSAPRNQLCYPSYPSCVLRHRSSSLPLLSLSPMTHLPKVWPSTQQGALEKETPRALGSVPAGPFLGLDKRPDQHSQSFDWFLNLKNEKWRPDQVVSESLGRPAKAGRDPRVWEHSQGSSVFSCSGRRFCGVCEVSVPGLRRCNSCVGSEAQAPVSRCGKGKEGWKVVLHDLLRPGGLQQKRLDILKDEKVTPPAQSPLPGLQPPRRSGGPKRRLAVRASSAWRCHGPSIQSAN